MSSPNDTTHLPPPLDLSGWKIAPAVLMVGGGILSAIGLLVSFHRDGGTQFGFSWLLAFMFYLTIALGALFWVLVHHLSDAGWSVATRRFCEHIASLIFPWLAILFLPILLLAPKIYHWMTLPQSEELIQARWPVFTCVGFVIVSATFFAIWWLLSSRLRYWSLRQDVTGDALCTHKMRIHSGWGIVALALTMTFSAILWMQSLQYQWFSAIYGVYFFADCAWISLATMYLLAVLLQRQRILDGVLRDHQFYFIGVMFFALTLFQAYAEFAQYFVVWNANMPEETFYYLIRENGSWFCVSMILIFGHCVLPFFILLPVKVKTNFKIMLPVCAWAMLMNFLDLAFNILPAANKNGYPLKWLPVQLGCMMFMGGFLAWIFLKNFASHPPYPQRDPRVLEAMGVASEPEEMPDTLPANGGDR
jgi:hypothetical protein